MKHSRSYYIIRSAVRFVFWTTVFTSAMYGAIAIAQIGQKPECPITLNIDFTYEINEPYDPDTCDLPTNITLESGWWRWTN
jgi:hypothetical protein